MSRPYEDHLYICGYCGDEFIQAEMVEVGQGDGAVLYCKPCYDELKEKGRLIE